MSKISCKVISVDFDKIPKEYSPYEDETESKEWREFYSRRYSERRKRINEFILSNDSEFDIQIIDAVTPIDFKISSKVIEFENKKFLMDKNAGYDSGSEVFYAANNLSHLKVWEIDEDCLILEDDISLSNEIMSNIKDSIDEFNSIDNDGYVLYLQISTPWLKDGSDKSIKYQQLLSKNLAHTESFDVSGTGAYYITKKTKKIFLENSIELCACDRFIDKLRKRGLVKYCIPLNKENMFSLDKETMWL
jgi:GR25 family glycosyltransferase involved in LPS biosynthesis